MECGFLCCQLLWYVCCGKDSDGGGCPVPYTLPSVDHVSLCMAVHGCPWLLTASWTQAHTVLFCGDSFLLSFQLFVPLLCHPSFSSVFLMPLCFTFSFTHTNTQSDFESFMFFISNFVIRPYHLKWKVLKKGHFFPSCLSLSLTFLL